MKHHKLDITHAQFFLLAFMLLGGGFIVLRERKIRKDCDYTVQKPVILASRWQERGRDGLAEENAWVLLSTFKVAVRNKWLKPSTEFGEKAYFITRLAEEIALEVAKDYPQCGDGWEWDGWAHPSINYLRKQLNVGRKYGCFVRTWEGEDWYRPDSKYKK